MSIEKLDLQSPDLVNENFEKLANLFPNCVTEGENGKAIDFDLLKQELSHQVIEGNRERYRLEWPGKREAIVTANLPTTKTLRPVREDSVDFDNTENLYIEGDNLEVLKLLQESYLGKIKMIYIDPPYNTGNDFVYKDNFSKDAQEELFESGQKDEYNQRLVPNPETTGRYHSDWLSMMYPRLKLARNLLKDDGMIFISIDEHEIDNLSKICSEIFGQENFVTNFCWEKKKKPSFLNKNLGTKFEYILVYTKRRDLTGALSIELTTEGKKYPLNNAGNGSATLNFPKGSVRFNMEDQKVLPQDMSEGRIKTILLDEIEIENGVNKNDFRLKGEWRYSQKKLNEIISNNEDILISKIPFRPNHLKKGGEIKKMHNLLTIKHYSVATNEDADDEQIELFGKSYFDYAKPTNLIKLLCQCLLYSFDNEIVLDFFSGSASTAHSLFKYNAENKKNIKSIQVQLPEATEENSEAYKAGYKNICEIGKERIRRAAKKIKEETGADIDYGFRVYRLDSSNMQDVYYKPQDYDQSQLDLFADNVKPDRTADDLLAQVMLDWGLPLSLKIETEEVLGKKVFKVAENSLYACFDKGIDEDFAKAIAKDKSLRIVFKDSSFKNDTAKTNVKQLLKQLSPETEMKVI
ncbi:DNA methylase [Riemerella anatipestifer]|uniref:site-specific DNA-methyltransferase n=1 Tax=Riemerella anatipestifer TaxID=34085 RepID=UPI0004DC41CE|nr:site-specific DNA-methyltransferase [Riemerella anatipestifer]AIH01386.1 adenine-specific DNA-methyltransferase [Riemerella anatipestifer CH3]MCO7331377.1 site-specific DNA-methyltransferase [Riemerella anatipestifer]MCO7350152.1 site-specific DNA-methyltransferase [Riemerella anatipestifer]MDD1552251.1 site-specific DNA-methyltransferase [Riemerella anatipestifer]MDD1595075.1 site-specific DNA-methyltransferase [Riemerella anatipestifer]